MEGSCDAGISRSRGPRLVVVEGWVGGGGRRRMVASTHPLSYLRLLKNLFSFSSYPLMSVGGSHFRCKMNPSLRHLNSSILLALRSRKHIQISYSETFLGYLRRMVFRGSFSPYALSLAQDLVLWNHFNIQALNSPSHSLLHPLECLLRLSLWQSSEPSKSCLSSWSYWLSLAAL